MYEHSSHFSPLRLSLCSKRDLGIHRESGFAFLPSLMDFSGCFNARDKRTLESTDPLPPERQPSDGMYGLKLCPDFLHSIIAKIDESPIEAIANVLDNTNGATRIKIDVYVDERDSELQLLIEDNGRGMDPNELRQCMSLSYPAKSSIADTIEPYGNSFLTSTMRVGNGVIVFTRSRGNNMRRPTQSIGLLSNKFLKTRSKEHIVVPMVDYERRGKNWQKKIQSTTSDWEQNFGTILGYSPFREENDILEQFDLIKDQGTRIFIYDIRKDENGLLELDFDRDSDDIQIRGVNRDEKNIDMATKYPNSRHCLTYRHSLRSCAAILYLSISPDFKIILRGKAVDHHEIVDDMITTQIKRDKGIGGILKNLNIDATYTVGFVKDARAHFDEQGFAVYYKNRLIKTCWGVWQPADRDYAGIIGVLEIEDVQPATEWTTILSAIEYQIIKLQQEYWNDYGGIIDPIHIKRPIKWCQLPDNKYILIAFFLLGNGSALNIARCFNEDIAISLLFPLPILFTLLAILGFCFRNAPFFREPPPAFVNKIVMVAINFRVGVFFNYALEARKGAYMAFVMAHVAIFCLMMIVQPNYDYGMLALFSTQPLLVLIKQKSKAWYLYFFSSVFPLLTCFCQLYFVRNFDRRYERRKSKSADVKKENFFKKVGTWLSKMITKDVTDKDVWLGWNRRMN